MDINEYLQKNKKIEETKSGYVFRALAPRVECADGFVMSVQVSDGHYCLPRINDASYYEAVEVGFPNQREELLMPYVENADKPTATVYGYVPVEVVDAVILKHGGFKQEH